MRTLLPAFPLWAGIVLTALLAQSVSSAGNDAKGTSGQSSSAPTEAELQAIYDAMPPEDQRLIDGWPSDQKRRHLLSRWSAEEAAAGNGMHRPAQETPGQAPTFVPYVLDPVLRDAYDAYVDEKRPSSEAIELLKQYAEANPYSEFLPEVYYRLGALYSIHRREGEEPNIALQVEYYSKAHELYGRKFDHVHRTVWATLANRSRSVETHREYYDWLVELQAEGTVEDIYPIRTIGQTRNGRWPKKTANTFQAGLVNMKWTLPTSVRVAEDNVLHFASGRYAALAELAAAYPGTRLGKLAAERLHQLDKATGGAIRQMDDPAFLNPVPASVDAELTDASGTSARAQSPPNAEGESKAGRVNGWMLAIIAAAIALLCGAVFWMFRHRLKRGTR